MIAEDEVLVRLGLSVSIDWEQLDVRLVAEAADGTEAMEAYRRYRPDIVITDIHMPGMDGLQFIRSIREGGERCAVIILTALTDFELLQEAMKLGVVTYLTKATLTQQEVAEAIAQAIGYLVTEGKAGKHSSSETRSISELLCQYALDGSLARDQLPADLPALGGCALIRLVPLYAARSSRMLREQSVYRLLHERFVRRGTQILCRQNDIVLLFTGAEPLRPDDCLSIIDSVSAYARLHFDLALHTVEIWDGLAWDALPAALSSARAALEQPWLFTHACLEMSASGALRIPRLTRLLDAVSSYAEHALPAGSGRAEVLAALDALRYLPGSRAELLARWAQLFTLLYEGGADLPPAELFSAQAELLGADGVDALIDTLNEALKPLICPAEGWSGRQLDIAINHMSQRLEDELTLSGVAAVAKLSPGYFSTLLKERTGMRFSEYLGQLRMEKAMKLLRNPSLSVAQVGERCGYADTGYFCRRFKQSTGKSPGQWRKK